MKKVGLFFGSFNPIHNGHLMLAQYFVSFTNLDEVCLVVSPQNPFKKKNTLLDQHQRLAFVKDAIEGNPSLKASDIEFQLPIPSYTIDTLTYLKEKNPNQDFVLIMGADNLKSFKKWKNHELILKHHKIFVYPRTIDFDLEDEWKNHPQIRLVDAPKIEVSSSFIRKAIQERKSIRYFLPENIYDYVFNNSFYQKN